MPSESPGPRGRVVAISLIGASGPPALVGSRAIPTRPSCGRVADHTDEGSGSDSQKPVVNDNVLYRALSALASAEVNFWFTCRRKRLVAQADRCGERYRMAFLATWASAYI